MGDKVCTQCSLLKSVEDFRKNATKKGGVDSACKACKNKQDKAYRTKNPEKMKEYREQNKERIKEVEKRYYETNKKEIAEYSAQYRKENAERINENSKEWRNNNKENIRIYSRKYKENNRDKIAVIEQRRRSGKANLPNNYVYDEWAYCLNYFDNKCCYCGSSDKLAQDHFIPLSKGGGYVKENIVPACTSCNSSKGNKLYKEWKLTKDGIGIKEEIRVYRYFISLLKGGEAYS